MKQKLHKIPAPLSSLLLTGLITVAAVMSAAPVYAAGASISLTANKTTVSAGSTVVIAVYMNAGGTPVNAVESDLTYPASQLQYVGISYSGSAFSINAPNNGGGGGSVTIGDGTTSPVSGSGLVATVTFSALVNSGSATIGVAGSSSLVNANDNSAVPFSAVGTSVRFGAPVAAAAPAASSSASKAAAAPASPAPPVAPKDTTPPVISDLKIASRTPYSAVISWTTNEPSDSDVDYGLDSGYGLSISSANLVTSHQIALDSSFLTPATVFHFRARSTDAAGNVQTGSDQTLGLPGVPVTVVVRGADGKPQAGAQVSIDSQSTTTNNNGQATLQSGLGNKQITTSFNGVTVQKPVTIARSSKALPPIQLDLSRQPLNHWMLVSIGLGIIILTLLGIDAVLFGSGFLTKLIRFRQPRIVTAMLDADEKSATSQPAVPVHEAPSEPVKYDTFEPFAEQSSTAVETAPLADAEPKPMPIISSPKAVLDLAAPITPALSPATTTAPVLMAEVKAPATTTVPTQINVEHNPVDSADKLTKAKASSVARRLKPRAARKPAKK